MKTKFLIFALSLVCYTSFAQQDAQYTQYMYNTININPAYAGSRGVMSIFGLHRTQWVGLDGAPTTNAFSLNTPINDSNLGLGLSFVNDKIGPTSDNTISADLSYTINTSDTFKLSFGVKASGNFFNLDVNKLNPADPADDNLQPFDNEFSPNIGAGLYLHSDKMYFGLSVPNFLQDKKYNDNQYAVFQERMNFYAIGGYVFDISQDVKFKPAFLTKLVTGSPLQVDASANFLFMDKFMLGAAYRWDAAVSAMAGFQVTDGLFIGYGYDRETTNLRRFNSGSHEVFLRFELFNKVSKLVSPRFF
ncbi:PorP/SprF family type IX secretion system membrane protein [Flavobacterium dankookense]|uniref:Type IX secretion system PorP/SprF family membrane protein n=1 Tax=Flavobacterium dankookense TaxID=706186 RepID=A0A4R6QHG0_9FLAO|nr:type IX secretion system membrane protein PorP/SprF [Flavobacterium dankookense]TDP61926.1 type IX secretion system PorP/SprF family membrane protein [Flavobacterium dankookense]